MTCAEDLTEGISIFDEYTPINSGRQKPMHTLTQDGLYGIADAVCSSVPDSLAWSLSRRTASTRIWRIQTRFLIMS